MKLLITLFALSLSSCALYEAGEQYYEGPGKERVGNTLDLLHDQIDEELGGSK